jgi:hypothetical protein
MVQFNAVVSEPKLCRGTEITDLYYMNKVHSQATLK